MECSMRLASSQAVRESLARSRLLGGCIWTTEAAVIKSIAHMVNQSTPVQLAP